MVLQVRASDAEGSGDGLNGGPIRNSPAITAGLGQFSGARFAILISRPPSEGYEMTLLYTDLNHAIRANSVLQHNGINAELRANLSQGAECIHRLKLPTGYDHDAIKLLQEHDLLSAVWDDE